MNLTVQVPVQPTERMLQDMARAYELTLDRSRGPSDRMFIDAMREAWQAGLRACVDDWSHPKRPQT